MFTGPLKRMATISNNDGSTIKQDKIKNYEVVHYIYIIPIITPTSLMYSEVISAFPQHSSSGVNGLSKCSCQKKWSLCAAPTCGDLCCVGVNRQVAVGHFNAAGVTKQQISSVITGLTQHLFSKKSFNPCSCTHTNNCSNNSIIKKWWRSYLLYFLLHILYN